MNDDNLIPDLPVTKNFEYQENKKYISIDISKANWFVMKKYDPEFINELGDTYEDFLNKFDVHPFFHSSKQFRQFIFGHVNPKRQSKAQRVIIEDVLNSVKRNNLELVSTRHDEIIFSFDYYYDIEHIIKMCDETKNFKWKIFNIKRFEDFRINYFYDENGSYLNKELSGCNGHKYFMYLKKYIFEETLDIRDLYFRIDGELAIWNVDGLDVKI